VSEHTIQTDFSAGTGSLKLAGRIDLEKYKRMAKCIRNMVVQPQGGAAKRAGLFYIAKAKYSTKKCRMEAFEYSTSVSYMLEVGDLYIRFHQSRALLRVASSTPAIVLTLGATMGFGVSVTAASAYFTSTEIDQEREITLGSSKARIRTVTSTTVATVDIITAFSSVTLGSGLWTITGIPVEVTTTYTEAELPGLGFAQQNDVMYIVEDSHPPAKLTRVTTTSFTLADVVFLPPPTYEAGIVLTLTGSNTLTLSAASVGLARTATFAGAHAPYLESDAGRTLTYGTGRATIVSVSSTTVATVDIQVAFSGTSLTTSTATIGLSPYARLVIERKGPAGTRATFKLADPNDTSRVGNVFPSLEWDEFDGFRSGDVGKYILGRDGVAKIYSVTNATTAIVQILKQFENVTQANLNAEEDGDVEAGPWTIGAGLWTLESETWDATRGYPAAVFFHDQRLGFGGSIAEPEAFWLSVTGDYENFGVGSNADDSVKFLVTSGKANQIRWGVSASNLLLGTLGAEHVARGGGSDDPISPTNVQTKPQSRVGSSTTVKGFLAENMVIYLQRGDQKVREIEFSQERERYESGDLSLIAENLFNGTKQLTYGAYLSSPDPYLLFTRNDGAMVVCAYKPAENVRAWSDLVTGHDQDYTDGLFESVAVMANNCGTADEVWVSVKRVLDSGTYRYIEVFDGQLNTDSAFYYSGTAINSIGGLTHLNGEMIYVIGDGTTAYQVVVSNGVATTSATHTTLEGGFNYGETLTLHRPIVQDAKGPSLGRILNLKEIKLLLHCTRGDVLINAEIIGYGEETQTYPFTGVVRNTEIGFDRDGEVSITKSDPFPLTVSAAVLAMELEDG
jgi:hypothetical protein